MQLKFDLNLYKYALIKFDYDYADEFDMKSLKVFTHNELETFLEEVKNNMSNIVNKELYFGTNEFILIENEADVWASLKISPISEQFYKEFKKVIKDDEFGTFSLSRLTE